MRQSLSNTVKSLRAVRLATLLKTNPRTGVSEPAVCRSSTKYVLLNNSRNSQENTCVRVSLEINFRSRRSQMFFKIIKRVQHRFFPVKFVKFLRTPCFTDHLQRLLLTVSGFQPATLLNKRLRQRCFSVKFPKSLRVSLDRTPLDVSFLCLSVNFEKFFRIPLL